MKWFHMYTEHSNMEEFIKVPKFYLSLMGCWPLGKSKCAWIYYLHSFLAAYLTSFIFMTSLTIDICLSFGNFESMADASYFYMTEFSFVVKFLIFTFKRSKFIKLLDELENPIFVSHRPEQEIYLKYWSRIACAYSHFFYGCCFFCSCFFAIFPLLDEEESVILPFRGWFPFDVEDNLVNRGFVYVFQLCCLWFAICVNCSLDVLPSIFMNIACAQIEILKNNLETATERAEQQVAKNIDEENERRWLKEFGENYSELLSPEADKIVQNILSSCVNHHVTITEYSVLKRLRYFTLLLLFSRFLADVESMFSMGMFVQFLDTVITICITGFQLIVVSGKSLKYLTTVIYLLAVTYQVACYCWNGHQVTVHSSSIGDSCYNMDWYRCSTKVRKTIFIIMERCKKPIIMTAGNFFTLSIMTLTGVLRTSYSYFAVLRRVYNE